MHGDVNARMHSIDLSRGLKLGKSWQDDMNLFGKSWQDDMNLFGKYNYARRVRGCTNRRCTTTKANISVKIITTIIIGSINEATAVRLNGSLMGYYIIVLLVG